MGHVFSAWDSRLHREVAIKLLNHEYAMPGMRERFLREARAASALNHPNICTIFDIGEQDGDPYLVMELLHGETLRDRIVNRTIQIDELVAIARDTAEALGAAHAKGVVHRDVKPANIFLVDKPNGGTQAKVLDFGLAKIEGGVLGARARSLDLTTEGATVGTLAYMSPEQARGEVLDSRSDLFSLGVVMYEMATRQVPFQGATSALVFVQLLNHAPEPVREWNEAIPRELEKIIFKLLAKERTARFQTARELELALIALNEKGSGGGWLRKAVATVPLVRVPDPVARERRLRSPHPSQNPTPAAHDQFAGRHSVAPTESDPPPRLATPVPVASETPRPPMSSDQVLRPVARVPRGFLARSSGVPPRPVERPASAVSETPPVAPAPEVLGPIPPEVPSSWSPNEPYELATALEPEPTALTPEPIPAPVEVVTAPLHLIEPVVAAPKSGGGLAYSKLEPEPQPTAETSRFRSTVTFPWNSDPLPDEDEPPLAAPRRADRNRTGDRRFWWVVAFLLLAVLAAAFFYLQNRSRFSATVLHRTDAIVVTEIENNTGDNSLDASVAAGLRIALAQSSYLLTQSGESYLAARHLVLGGAEATPANALAVARQTAQRLGAKAYIYGTISGGAPYVLRVDLRYAATNEILTSSEAHAESLQQIPDAIDQVAGDLRISIGEPHESFDRTSTPVSRESTASLAALQLYAQAQSLLLDREPVSAVGNLQEAVRLDPRFIQAQALLARTFQQLRAESAAADAAQRAFSGADQAGERTRTLAEANYELIATGNYPRAAALLHRLVSLNPQDSQSLTALATALRLEGHLSEALQTAEQGYTADPYNATAYEEAEDALIALDRYDAAYQLTLQEESAGLSRRSDALLPAYLDGKQDVVDDITSNIPEGRMEYRPGWTYGLYLDNEGHLAAGASLWRARAAQAAEIPSLRSAAPFLLAQGALDRALLDDCQSAVAMATEADRPANFPPGRTTLFNLALADALCGDSGRAREIASELQQKYPNSFDMVGFYIADIEGALALRNHDASGALDALQPARAFDLVSLTPYLRGRAHMALHQDDVGVVDFQTILSHRGLTFAIGSDVYPAAQIALAQTFADSGDAVDSTAQYRQFLAAWRTADLGSPLLNEARSRAGT
jgi:serine/threonine protein kinase/tetratricopeptide (TPR) repeat protein